MILDRLENSMRYVPLHPGFEAAFNFLKQSSLNEFKEGKIGDILIFNIA
jgi:beta-galactosidase beta subunit